MVERVSRSWGSEGGRSTAERGESACGGGVRRDLFTSSRLHNTGTATTADHDTQIDRIYRRPIVVYDEICCGSEDVGFEKVSTRRKEEEDDG